MALQFLAKAVASAGLVGFLAGIMLHFHIGTYPYLASAFTGSLVIYLWTRPGRGSLGATLSLGAAFFAVYAIAEGGPPLGAWPAFLGLGSLASLSLTALWTDAAGRQASLDTCLTGLMFPMFLIVSGFSLAVTNLAHPKTYDLFLYAFDAQWGRQPSFLVGRLLARFGALREVCYFSYEGLPFAMAIAFAMERSKPGRQASRIMAAFAVAAAGGFLSYNLYPAVGPVHVFGPLFPNTPPLAGRPPFRLVAVESAARNAMPSVHVAMALLIVWNSRPWPASVRVLSGALLALTVLATLGFGEHYLVDIFVAVPFALLAQGLAANEVPWRSMRIACVAAGALSVLAWLMYLRLPTPPSGSRGLAWGLLIGTAAASVIMESRLGRYQARARVPPPALLARRNVPAWSLD